MMLSTPHVQKPLHIRPLVDRPYVEFIPRLMRACYRCRCCPIETQSKNVVTIPPMWPYDELGQQCRLQRRRLFLGALQNAQVSGRQNCAFHGICRFQL